MKLTDIIDESQLDEFIPLTKQGRMIRKAEKAGAADLKQSVDDLTSEFAALLGSQGKKFKTATTDDVVNFLKSKKVDTKRIDTTKPMDQNRIKDIFTTLIKDKMAGANLAGGGEDPAAQPEKQSSAYVKTKDAALKLNAKEKRRLADQLLKSIKSPNKPADKVQPKPRVRVKPNT